MQKGNNDDEDRFAVAIAALGATFGREADVAMIDGYWLGLVDLPIGAIEAACATALVKMRRMPLPVDLRDFVQLVGLVEQASQAWPAVVKAARSSSPPDDEISAAVVEQMGGARRLGLMPESEIHVWGRKEFERLYVECRKDANRKMLPYPFEPIPGRQVIAEIESCVAAVKGMDDG